MYTLSIPVISTEHMPMGAVEDFGTAILHAPYDDGAFVYVGYGEEDFEELAWLNVVANWAQSRMETGYCGWVRFDRDGDVESDLPTFEWI